MTQSLLFRTLSCLCTLKTCMHQFTILQRNVYVRYVKIQAVVWKQGVSNGGYSWKFVNQAFTEREVPVLQNRTEPERMHACAHAISQIRKHVFVHLQGVITLARVMHHHSCINSAILHNMGVMLHSLGASLELKVTVEYRHVISHAQVVLRTSSVLNNCTQ